MRNKGSICIVITLAIWTFQFRVIQSSEICSCTNGGGICNPDKVPNCICPVGYHGNVCEFIDECLNNPCSGFSTCVREGDGFKCVCPEGYTGPLCDTDTRILSESCFCANDGICNPDEVPKCICPAGFFGDDCEFLDECLNNPCSGFSTCVREGDGFKCVCPEGYTGVLCDTRNPCFFEDNCLNGTCSPESNYKYNCLCDEKFYGRYCQFTNSCINFPCGAEGKCLNDENAYSCECGEGFGGINCQERNPCFFEDPCLHGTCSPESNYTSKCLCNEAFYGQFCQFTDSCISFPCGPQGKCINDDNEYICECDDGYDGQNCEKRDPCVLDKIECPSGQHCQRIDDKIGKCFCDGESCEQKNLCSSTSCLNGGECKLIENEMKCKCPFAFSGLFCEIRNPCKLNPTLCGQHIESGTCHRLSDTEVKCECFENFYGDNCEFEDVCRSNPCLNGGICRNEDKGSFECQCPRFTYGKTCETHVKPPKTVEAQFSLESDDFLIPEKAYIGEKVNFHAAIFPENLTSDFYFEWVFGDGSSYNITVPEILEIHRNRKRESEDESVKAETRQTDFTVEHVFNETGVFFVQVYAVSDLLTEKRLKKASKVIILGETCNSTLRIHNVGHDNETTPMYTRQQSIMAWAILYVVCKPKKLFRIKYSRNRNFKWDLFTEIGSKTFEVLQPVFQVQSVKNEDEGEQNIVSFAPWSLPYGLYRLHVTTIVDLNEDVHFPKPKQVLSRHLTSLSNTADGTFKIIQSPPRARIHGGDYQIVSPNDKVVLDASESTDPDFGPSEGHKLEFRWSCSNGLTFPDASTCGLSLDSIDWRAQKITFDANKLPQNANNIFSLTVTSDKSQNGRSLLTMADTAKQIVIVSPNVYNTYSIICIDNCGQEVIPEKKTLLVCMCGSNGNCTNETSNWNVTFTPNLDSDLWKAKPTHYNGGFTLGVFIRPDALKTLDSSVTQVKMSCRAKGDTTAGMAEYSFRVHQPPTSKDNADPFCDINPMNGTAIHTRFTINCPTFESRTASPVTYSLYAKIEEGYLSNYSHENGFLLRHEIVGSFSPGSGSSEHKMFFDFILPAGNSKNNYTLPISIDVTDSMGSTWNMELRVNPRVKPPENVISSVSESMDNYSITNRETTRYLLTTGNRGGLFRLILAGIHQMSLSKNFTDDKQRKIKERFLHALNRSSAYSERELKQRGTVLNIRDVEQMTSLLYAIVFHNPRTITDKSFIYATDLVILIGYQLEATMRPLQNKEEIELTELRIKSMKYLEYLHLPLIRTGIEIVVELLKSTHEKQEKILQSSGLHQQGHAEHEIIIGSHRHDEVEREYFREEFPRYDKFTYTLLQSGYNPLDSIEEVTTIAKRLMDTLRRLGNALGSGLFAPEEPAEFHFGRFLSMYVAVKQAYDLRGARIPDVERNGTLFDKNYMVLSMNDMNVSSQAKFLQLIALVSTFNPYVDERQENPIDTPLLHIELSEITTLETVTNAMASNPPHTIHLEYLKKQNLHVRIKDKFEKEVKDEDHRFLINTDLSNLKFEEIIVHHFSLPPLSKIFVLIENTLNLDVLMVLKSNSRPTCVDFRTDRRDGVHNDSLGKLIYQFHTNNASNEGALDYYATFWPTKESIAKSGNKFLNNTAEIGLSFARLRCISRRQIVNGEWSEEGCTVALDENSNSEELTCHCNHLSIFSGSLRSSHHTVQPFEKIELFPEEYDTTLIPFVVTGILILYLILLPIALWKDKFNRSTLPSLYVMCDIKRIQDEATYLLTLETGNNFLAGTSANVGCQIYGERGRSQPYVLSDAVMDSTRQNTTADFIISSEKYLGKLEKIRIWHDNTGQHPSWYCRKVTIRDLKTDEVWYFFLDKWLTIKHTTQNSSLISEIRVATDSEVLKYFKKRTISFRKYWYQIRSHHLWLSGFTCSPSSPFTRSERLTCAMGVFCSYFFTLVLLYRRPPTHGESETVEFGGLELDREFILTKGTISAIIGMCISFVLINLFRRIRRKKIPALVVQGGMNPYLYYRRRRFGSSFRVDRTDRKELEKDLEYLEAKQDELHRKKKNKIETEPNLVKIKSYTDFGKDKEYFELFRIPSTDMVGTEDWIAGTMDSAETEGQNVFVHSVQDKRNYGSWGDKKHSHALKIMQDFGLSGELVNVCDENPLCFDYRPGDSDRLRQRNPSTISESEPLPRGARLMSIATAAADANFEGKEFEIKEDPDTVADENDDPVVPFYQPRDFEASEEEVQFDVTLGKINDPHEFAGWLPPKFVYIAWAICIVLIITTCAVTIVFGLRYSYRRSVFWVLSLITAFLESFLILQPLQILVTYIFIVVQIKTKKRKTDDELFLLQRLRVFWVDKISDIKLWPLNYKLYFPQNVVPPLSGSQAFIWKMHSRRKLMMRRGLLDLFMFSVFLIILLYTMTKTQDYDHYNSLQNMKYMLRTSYDDHVVHDVDAFWNIRDESDFYDYMKNAFVPVVYTETSFNGEPLDDDQERLVWLQNRQSFLLGVPRIRQLRVKNDSKCDYYSKITENAHHHTQHICSEEFQDSIFYSNKETANFSEGWKPVEEGKPRVFAPTNDLWRYRDEEETGSVSRMGVMGLYDGGGYIAELGRTREETRGVLRHMERMGWIDVLTRAVIVEFNAYNPNVNLFTIVVLILERSSVECFRQDPIVLSTRFVDEMNVGNPLSIAFGICVLYLMYSTFRPVFEHIFQRKKGRSLNWTIILDFVSAIIGLTICISYIVIWTKVHNKFTELREAPLNAYVSVQKEQEMCKTQLHLYCILMLLCLCKLWKLLLLSNRRFFIIGFTLSITRPFMLGYILMGLIMLIPFSLYININFNSAHDSFRSFGSTILTLIYQMEVGNVLSYKALVIVSPIFGALAFFLYNISVVFLYKNVFISALTLGLQGAKETSLQRPFRLSYAGYIWLKLQIIIPSCIRKIYSNQHLKHSLPDETISRMTPIFEQILTSHMASIEVHRMKKMKSLTENFLTGSRLCLISKKEKMVAKKNGILKIEEDRLNNMRKMTVHFIKDKLRWEFQADELQKYDDFNFKILKLKCKKVKKRFIQLIPLLEKYLKHLQLVKVNIPIRTPRRHTIAAPRRYSVSDSVSGLNDESAEDREPSSMVGMRKYFY